MIFHENDVLGFTETARLLSWLFPSEKKSWHLQLAEIVLGMKPYRYRIPYHPCFEDIYFQVGDVRDFAIIYSEGSVHESEIESRMREFLATLETEHNGQASTKREIHSTYVEGNGFLGVKPEGDPAFFRLSKPEAHKLFCDVVALTEQYEKLLKSMRTVSVMFRVLNTEPKLSSAEAAAIQEQIWSYVEQAEELLDASTEISEELGDRLEALEAA